MSDSIEVSINTETRETRVTDQVNKVTNELMTKQPEDGARVDNFKTAEFNAETGEDISKPSHVEVSTADIRADQQQALRDAGYSEALSSITRNGEAIHPDDAEDTDLITLNGITTTVKAAKAAGFFVDNGRYFEEVSNEPQEVEEAPAVPFSDPKAEANFANLGETIGDASVNRLMEEAISTGEIKGESLDSLAAAHGLDRGQLEQQVNQVKQAFQNQVAQAFGNQEDLADFANWCESQGDRVEALIQLTQFRDPTKLNKMIDRWSRENPPSKEALENAGYKTFTNDGRLYFKHPQAGEMLVSAAAKQGLI